MRILFGLAFFIMSTKIFTQVNANCIQAIPLCSNPGFTFFATSGPGAVTDFSAPALSFISNPTPNPNPPNTGCLMVGEFNPQWLILKVSHAGTLEFVFGAGNSTNPQVGFYDWAMWPYTANTCANINNNSLSPIRCNWNGSGAGGTGVATSSNFITFGGAQANFETPLQVNACDEFVICISNYSGVNSLVSFLSLGTASIVCSPSVTVQNIHSCSQNTVLTAPSGFANYQWYNTSGLISSSAVLTTSTAGSYSVVYGNGNLCPSPNTIFQLSLSVQNLSLTSSNTLICEGESATLSAGTLNNYSWSNGAGTMSVVVSPTTTTIYSLSSTDSFSCVITNTITQFVSPCIGLFEKNIAKTELTIYPNPNSGEFELNIKQPSGICELLIINLLGEIVAKQLVTEGKNLILLNNINPGIYCYCVRQGETIIGKGLISID